LASGDLIVKTGSVANNIDIDQPLTWASTSRLILDAQRSVIVKKPVTVTGSGALTIASGDGDKHGEFITDTTSGSIQFWDLASSLIIDRKRYTLVGDLETLAADIAAKPSGLYALAKPYDVASDGTYKTSPIETIFEGRFEGLGNSFRNLAIKASGDEPLGLFQQLDETALIENLNLFRVHIHAPQPTSENNRYMGGLVGKSAGTLRNDSVSGKVIGSADESSIEDDGGLVGLSYGLVIRCHAAVDVTYGAYSGGLVGVQQYFGFRGGIENSFATGNVSGFGYAGGARGFAWRVEYLCD